MRWICCCTWRTTRRWCHAGSGLEKLRQKKANFFNTFTPAAREILDTLLEKYADYGIGQLDDLPSLFKVQPFSGYGSPMRFMQFFGGAEKMMQAVDELQKSLYEG